jgi:HEAT repeat protein
MTIDELISRIAGQNEGARAEAWQSAGSLGAAAIKPLAPLMDNKDTEARRAAARAAWKIVRHAGRPGAEKEAAAVSAELIGLLGDGQPWAVRREAAWMLSEIAGEEAVDPLARLLADKDLREHVRAALQRIPGPKSLAALKAALETAPVDYKPALAESLRRRGEEVPGVKSLRLVPAKATAVKPVGR